MFWKANKKKTFLLISPPPGGAYASLQNGDSKTGEKTSQQYVFWKWYLLLSIHYPIDVYIIII